MNIQNTSNIDFQATRVLTVKRNVPRGKSDIVEVFRLNQAEDQDFIKQCYDLFVKNKNLKLNIFEKRCKSLFSDLLVKANASSEDFYLAVKNNERIVGCLNSLPFMRDVIPLNLFTREDSSENINTLFYAFLKDSQKKYIGFNIKMDVLSRKTIANKELIKFSQIDSIKNKIKKASPKLRFKSEEKNKIDLYDVFGARDFETEIYPNLK